jgi:hypothetical protein
VLSPGGTFRMGLIGITRKKLTFRF